MYVDPDKIKISKHIEEALDKDQHPSEKFSFLAITNLMVPWKQKFIIRMILKVKQKNIPVRLIVADKSKVLVEQQRAA